MSFVSIEVDVYTWNTIFNYRYIWIQEVKHCKQKLRKWIFYHLGFFCLIKIRWRKTFGYQVMLECVEQIKGPKQLYIASPNRLNHDRFLKMHVCINTRCSGYFSLYSARYKWSTSPPHPPSHSLLLSIFVNICALNL